MTLSDPIVLKGGAGLALWAFAPSRTLRMGGIALAAWAAWDYYQATRKTAPAIVPYDPDAPMPLPLPAMVASGSTPAAPPGADPFAGTKWEGAKYTPSIRPARPGEPGYTGAQVIPLRPPTHEQRAMFYGADDDER